MFTVNDNLSELLREAETLFNIYQVSYPLAICQCNCCMPLEAQREFLRIPVTTLNVDWIRCYLSSVPISDQAIYIREIKYFLPRILYGLCAFEDISSLTETTLSKLYLHRHDCWHKAELLFMQRFAAAFIHARCLGEAPFPSKEHTLNICSEDTISNYILMFHWAGLNNTTQLCDLWSKHAHHINALRHFVALWQTVKWQDNEINWYKTLYLPEFFEERTTFVYQINEWFTSQITCKIFKNSLEIALLDGKEDSDETDLWESCYDWLDSIISNKYI